MQLYRLLEKWSIDKVGLELLMHSSSTRGLLVGTYVIRLFSPPHTITHTTHSPIIPSSMIYDTRIHTSPPVLLRRKNANRTIE
jgi:hypothetical protein